ncbi:MAG: hypothetical protein IT452_09085 [Planctomycetia bacterium]|nr:hypothetical protein [Planctomycetia bacterium]
MIRGVSLITGGLTARGHELFVDDTTISQMLASGISKGTVPVKLDHKSGVENVCGFVTNFRVEGNKLLGDWHLLRTHPHYETTMEKAERMPTCFGLSAAFVGQEEVREGRKLARCQELLAVDCVTQPAANPTGLFERPVDTPPKPTMNPVPPPQAAAPADPNQELAALRAENANLNERLEVVEHFCAALHESLSAGEDLPPAEEQDREDLAAIQAGMVELNRKLEAAEKKGKEHETALATRDQKITELETRLAARAGDKGGAPTAPPAGTSEEGAPTPASATAEAPAPGAPKLTKFEAKVEAEVKGGKKRAEAIKALVSAEPQLFQEHLAEKGVLTLGG